LKGFKKEEEYYLPKSIITCGETSNLSTVSALQVNVILLKKYLLKLHKTLTVARTENNRQFITGVSEKETVAILEDVDELLRRF
jgi:hypothetical protein